jgi:hypothetical protein
MPGGILRAGVCDLCATRGRRIAAKIRLPRLFQYQRTRRTFAQLKLGFGIPRTGFGLCTGYRSRELGGVHQTVDGCTPASRSFSKA